MLVDAGEPQVYNRITCLTGVSSAGVESTVDTGLLSRSMVLRNNVIFGSVNANRDHYAQAADALAGADASWLAGLITRRAALVDWCAAYSRRPDDIKTVLEFTA